jgi:hypothetical protein
MNKLEQEIFQELDSRTHEGSTHYEAGIAAKVALKWIEQG